MRKIVVVLLLFAQVAQGQDSATSISLFKYLKDAKRIMDTLKIDVRETINMDGELNVKSYDSLGNVGAFFHADYTFLDSSKNKFYYKNPVIVLTNKTAERLFEIEDASSDARILAEAKLIHEICHYLQSTRQIGDYLSDLNKISIVDHIKQRIEYEAYAVGGYYLLEKVEPEYLNIIMNGKSVVDEKIKMIIMRSYLMQTGKRITL